VCFRSGSRDRNVYDQFIDSDESWDVVLDLRDKIIRFPRKQSSKVLQWNTKIKDALYFCVIVYYSLQTLLHRTKFVPIFSDGVGRFRYGFSGRRTSPFIFWWNDDSQIYESISTWKIRSKKPEYKYFVANLIHETNFPLNHQIVMKGNFCFTKISSSVFKRDQLRKSIVFAGNIDLSGSRVFDEITSADNRNTLKKSAQIFAMEISEKGISSQLMLEWKGILEEIGSEAQISLDESWLYLGNLVRNEFLKKICATPQRRNLNLYLNYQGGDAPREVEKYLKAPNYEDINNAYRQALISLDFGSRWLNKPVECYERTTKIVTNGFGLVRFVDINPSALFAGLGQKRQFQGVSGLLEEIERVENLNVDDWITEGNQIRTNYLFMQAEQLAELNRILHQK
jgi:hypothetical protein